MSNEIVTSPELAPPVGYAHAVVGAPGGRTVHLGGQTALGADGEIHGETLAEQFDVAAGNVVAALRAAGGAPEDLVQMLVFVTDVAEYKASLRDLGDHQVFRTVIRQSVKVGEAPTAGVPITVYDPKSDAAKAFIDLAKEVANAH